MENKYIIQNEENYERSEELKTKRKLTEEENLELFEAIRDEGFQQVIELLNIMDDVNDIFLNLGGFTPLTHSCQNERIDLVKYLIEFGADVNKVDNNKNSPLMVASKYGNIEIAQILIDAGADIDFINEFGNSALSSATSFNDNSGIFEFLISFGVSIEICGGMALICASNGDVYFAKRLIELGVDVNKVYLTSGWTPLHCAYYYNNLEVVELLLKNYADECIKNSEGKTAIELTENEEIKEFINNFKPTRFILK